MEARSRKSSELLKGIRKSGIVFRKEDKSRFRSNLLQRLKNQKEDIRRRKSEAIERKLLRHPVFRRAKTVMCYVSLPYEVQTGRLIEKMLATGKNVVVPKVSRGQLRLSLLKDPSSDLSCGAFGVMEPDSKSFRAVPKKELDLVLVPGIAFDRKGHRLGHGKGYFDRFLSRLPKDTPTIGLCFDFQLLDSLPTDPHDKAVWKVLSA